jgi:hypothetical protein
MLRSWQRLASKEHLERRLVPGRPKAGAFGTGAPEAGGAPGTNMTRAPFD